MITYQNIINDLNAFKLTPIKLKLVCEVGGIICEEITGVQVYAPSIAKGRYMDFVETLFAGRGLTISYLPNSEMIHIEIPVAEENKLHPLFENIISSAFKV